MYDNYHRRVLDYVTFSENANISLSSQSEFSEYYFKIYILLSQWTENISVFKTESKILFVRKKIGKQHKRTFLSALTLSLGAGAGGRWNGRKANPIAQNTRALILVWAGDLTTQISYVLKNFYTFNKCLSNAYSEPDSALQDENTTR